MKAEFTQLVSHKTRSAVLLEGQFGIAMELPAPFDQLTIV
jgi:hypothetical protein